MGNAQAWNCRDRDTPQAAGELHFTPSWPTLPSRRGADEPGENKANLHQNKLAKYFRITAEPKGNVIESYYIYNSRRGRPSTPCYFCYF